MPAHKKDAVWVAQETFAAQDDDGSPVIIHKDETRIREGHPLLDKYRGYFKPAEEGVQFDVVEQATAAPGEKRGQPRS